MIKYVEPKNIDKQKWDDVITNSPISNIFCYSWYLDTVSDNWGALIKGDYDLIMPIPYTKKLGIKQVYLPFFARELTVFSKSVVTESLTSEFLKQIPKEFRSVNIGFTKIEGIPQHFRIEEFPHQELSIDEEYININTNFSTNAKRIIKKTHKQELNLKPLGKVDEIVELFKSTKGRDIKSLGEQDYQNLIALMQACLNHKKGQAYGVYQKDELLSCGFFMIDKLRITYLKGASTEKGKKIGASYFLFDRVIEKYSGKHYVLDFGGSKIEGVANFYKKFGASDAFYLFLTHNNLPSYFKLLKKVKNKL